jgi:hypothetical protein
LEEPEDLFDLLCGEPPVEIILRDLLRKTVDAGLNNLTSLHLLFKQLEKRAVLDGPIR